ncbi:MAG: M23 family metallopeptidase [Candidatus Obscuribacterales bacterium]|nr:M23 family metallopeptidase [Candidatus Obscuribacterales bacterium]
MTTRSRALLRFVFAIASILVIAAPALAYYFEGYYVPCFLISPMLDDRVYTPVGMGMVTSKAGFRVHPVTGKGDFHNGVDLAAQLNDKVFNLLDGMVTRVGYRGNLGVAVEIYHPYPNVRTICGHLNAYAVKPGMWVRRGQVIAFAGSTGRSTGVHLHYTVIKNDTNQYIEPMTYLMQVPDYVAALKTARIQQFAKQNASSFQKKQAQKKDKKDEDINDEDLPQEGSEESAPPAPDKK